MDCLIGALLGINDLLGCGKIDAACRGRGDKKWLKAAWEICSFWAARDNEPSLAISRGYSYILIFMIAPFINYS